MASKRTAPPTPDGLPAFSPPGSTPAHTTRIKLTPDCTHWAWAAATATASRSSTRAEKPILENSLRAQLILRVEEAVRGSTEACGADLLRHCPKLPDLCP